MGCGQLGCSALPRELLGFEAAALGQRTCQQLLAFPSPLFSFLFSLLAESIIKYILSSAVLLDFFPFGLCISWK